MNGAVGSWLQASAADHDLNGSGITANTKMKACQKQDVKHETDIST
jgi:hypothetical protein